MATPAPKIKAKLKAKPLEAKYYYLSHGLYVAYLRDGHWYYTNDDGIEKLCGKHSALGSSTDYKPRPNYNKEIATQLVDALLSIDSKMGLNHCYFSEFTDGYIPYFSTVDYLKTYANWRKICPYVFCPLDTWPEEIKSHICEPTGRVYVTWGCDAKFSEDNPITHCKDISEELEALVKEWYDTLVKHRELYLQTVVFK